MKDFSISPSVLENTPRTADSLVRAWQVGQILKVRAESDSDPAGQLLLRIGKLKVAARTPLPIKAGEAFAAQIQSLGEVPVLKVLSSPEGPQRAVAQYLRESLPRQADFTPLMQRLLATADKKNPLPPPVKDLAQAIARNIPTTNGLKNATQVRSALANSGVLLESRLDRAQPATTPLKDLKAQLLQLRSVITKQLDDNATLPARQAQASTGLEAPRQETAQSRQQLVDLFVNGRLAPESLVKSMVRQFPSEEVALLLRYLERVTGDPRPMPDLPDLLARVARFIQAQPNPQSSAESLLTLLRNTLALQELQQLTDSALSRIQANQLSSVSRETGTAFLLHLDLPVMHDKEVRNLQLQLERREESDDSPESWNVTINFNLPELGPVQARLRLQENRLVTRFEAERSATVSGIREGLPHLQEALARAGVSIEHLSVEQGKVQPDRKPPPAGHHLLDEMA